MKSQVYAPRSTVSSFKIPPQAAQRIGKIRDLLNKAIVEVRNDISKSPPKSPLKRLSDESSEAE